MLSQPWPEVDESLQQEGQRDRVEFVLLVSQTLSLSLSLSLSTSKYRNLLPPSLKVNGRKSAILSLPSDLVETMATEELRREVVRGAVGEGVIEGEAEVGRVVVVPHRHLANIVTK